MSTCSWSGPILIKISSSCSIVNGAKKIIILIASIASNDLFYLPFYFAFTHLTENSSSCTYYMVMDKIFIYINSLVLLHMSSWHVCLQFISSLHHPSSSEFIDPFAKPWFLSGPTQPGPDFWAGILFVSKSLVEVRNWPIFKNFLIMYFNTFTRTRTMFQNLSANIKGYKMQAMPRILYKHFSVRLVSLLLHGSFLAFDWFQIISSQPFNFQLAEKNQKPWCSNHMCVHCV